MKHELFSVQGASVDTGGWDTVSAIHISELNRAIQVSGTSPDGFTKLAQTGVKVTADFGDWKILPDSDGPTLSMELPLSTVVVKEGGQTRRYAQASALVDVHLELLPHDPNDQGNERLHLLVVKLKPGRGKKHPATVTKVTIQEQHSITDEVYISMALGRWLDANLHSFTQVFATVNIHQIVEQNEAFSWLKPTHVAYAFGYNALDPENSILGVLCQTGGRSADGLIYQVQAETVPAGATAGYVISRARFLRDMLATALPLSFDGLKLSNLKIDKDNSGLEMKKPCQLKNVESDGKTYNPKLTLLDLRLDQTELSLESVTKTRIFPGIFSVCSAIGHYTFGLIVKKDGTKTLGYQETLPFKSENTTEKTKAAKITEIILGIIAAVAGLVLMICTVGSGTLLAYALYTALYGGIATITAMEAVELIREGDGPPVDALIFNATSAVTWSTGCRFDPTSAGLNGDMLFGGNFVEDPTLAGQTNAGSNHLSPQAAFQKQFAARMKERSL